MLDLGRASHYGDRDTHGRPVAGSAVHVDVAAVVLYDPQGHGHPESRPGLPRREKGHEQLVHYLLGNTGAVVADRNYYHVSGLLRRDIDRPAVRHRLDRVADDVEERLLELIRVPHRNRQPVREVADQPHPRREHPV